MYSYFIETLFCTYQHIVDISTFVIFVIKLILYEKENYAGTQKIGC